MPTFRQHLRAIWKKQCPRCLQGAIYESGMRMHDRCPVCDLLLKREQGYFMGAMYISYALASLLLGAGIVIVHLLAPTWDLGLDIVIVFLAFLPFAAAVTRYSRVIWIHFDRWAWPDPSQPLK
jgi:uncharacterized protein (DUF983 family)